MTFANPAALWFLLLVPLLILLYVLRAQHRHHRVPSTFLWRHLPNEMDTKPTVRMPITNWLFWLQIIAVILAAMTLALPQIDGQQQKHVILVIDTSASMNATDVDPSRFDAAVGQAKDLVEELRSIDRVSIVEVGLSVSVRGRFLRSEAALQVLDRLSAGLGTTDPSLAFTIAEQIGESTPEYFNSIVFFTDAADRPPDDLRNVNLSVEVVSVAGDGSNRAITEIDVRPAAGAPGRYTAFYRVANLTGAGGRVEAVTKANGIEVDRRFLNLPNQMSADVAVVLPIGTTNLTVEVAGGDVLQIDDKASASIASLRRIRVVIISPNRALWERALRAIPGVDAQAFIPERDARQVKLPPAEVYLFERFLPVELPKGGVIIVNPPAGVKQLGTKAQVKGANLVRVERDSPLMRSIDLSSLFVAESMAVERPIWSRTLVESTAGPMIYYGVVGESRIVVFAFDPQRTDLPQRIAFPILVNNLLEWLAPEELPAEVEPGEIVPIAPLIGSGEIHVHRPNGTVLSYPVRGSVIRFAETNEKGTYRIVEWATGIDEPVSQRRFIINGLDHSESDLHTNPNFVSSIEAIGVSATEAAGQVPVWFWVAGALLILVIVEWWYYGRRWAY